MKTLRIMTPDFELRGEITRYKSLQITRRFFSTGDFELHVPDSTSNVEQIARGSRLFSPTAPEKMMMVDDLEYSEAKREWTFKGPMLDGLVKLRLAVPPKSSDGHFGWDRPDVGDAETIFQHFIANNMVSPEDPTRAIPRMVMAENQHRGMTGVYWQGRFDELAQLLRQHRTERSAAKSGKIDK